MNRATKQTNKADTKPVFEEMKTNIDILRDIQLNVVYPAIHNNEPINFDELIKNSKNLSEKIIYFLGKNGLELRTLNLKDEKNIAGAYRSKTDGRVRLRFANSKNTTDIKEFSTIGHIIALIKEFERSKKYSLKATRNTIKDGYRFHGHHIDEVQYNDTEENIKGLWDTKHKQLHMEE